ncbi:MAG TPA: sigma-70 family RNA polymerase sigma factor [Thermoanaerobaculia bacterium]|nr:sigma-70 family RNA polymerase sigma factor [Thermoanaerobaculia bacterium]
MEPGTLRGRAAADAADEPPAPAAPSTSGASGTSGAAGAAGAGGVGELVDHLFRHSAGQMVATLTRMLGPQNLSLAEEVVQDALVRAIETWPHRGVPENPRGWLMQVARNRALDCLRRDATRARKAGVLAAEAVNAPAALAPMTSMAPMPPMALTTPANPLDPDASGSDDTLVMILMCCHPALAREAQVALTLKTVGGFSVDEIARAFLLRPAAVAQRLVRAKRLLRERRIAFELPARGLGSRIDSALETMYLMFNEGYAATAGDDLVRSDLCGEAVRLATILADHPATSLPEVHALLALMLFQASRLPARCDAEGALVLLADQDRRRWNRALIGRALGHLERCAAGERATAYHLEAGIAACHAMAPSYAATDWAQILALYDDRLALAPSPVVVLNRAVALSMVQGPRAGIAALAEVADDPHLRGYYLLPATLADLWLRCGDRQTAAAHYRRALELPCSEPERRFLLRRLAACEPCS